ncbi:hypothetical protein [Plantactinospora sp. KBS50]|uniref:DUF7144 family membrane protein n=1 Tax=Plantactinospora sp. KBS50 TaxID=2024580 RepID=UPI000BAAAD1B|nr:hypothetical protein [Plantactinospora sp. KBS50]ASW52966.1 hypothetical protein CIK06_00335 [Plantactinospora sp. KBS50]
MVERLGGARASAAGRYRPPLLAGGLLGSAGLIDVLSGYDGLTGDPYVIVTSEGLSQLDITGWAWLLLGMGILAVAAGLAVVGNRRWAIVPAIGVAVLDTALHLALFPFVPFVAVMLWVVNGAVIRLLLVHRRATAR